MEKRSRKRIQRAGWTYDSGKRRLHFVPEDDVLYNSAEAADYLRTTSNSLHVSRCLGRLHGLPVVRLGSRVLFRGQDLKAYVAANLDATGRTRPQTPRRPSPGRPRGRTRVA